MIKIGENVIGFTETEYGIETDDLFTGEPLTVMVESRREAKRLALTLDGKVKTRTIYYSEWTDAK